MKKCRSRLVPYASLLDGDAIAGYFEVKEKTVRKSDKVTIKPKK